ncbi:MAG TPA: hypothetical protein VGS07_31095 [Thermoanaerobaculia bacterium]|jgi:hypothetical protein|nr:hypothetical protein [Thermoanaerobaculia bacterium]
MGLFDTIYCEYPLPNPAHQALDFQTKNLDCGMETYTITHDGRLIRRARKGVRRQVGEIEWPLHGDIRIYTSLRNEDSPEDRTWVEYAVRFTHGRVEWIRPHEEVPPSPEEDFPEIAWPWPWNASESIEIKRTVAPAQASNAPEIEGEAAPGTETALLLNLQRSKSEMEALLGKCNDHWGYEDPVYRFYHQSFKVYWLQESTRSIVDKLQTLVPERPLNPWFVQIIESGTGKRFQSEDNAHWLEVTRPILEAFFHARYFLEMAVRYADLKTPPEILPSGYAVLLTLFGLR